MDRRLLSLWTWTKALLFNTEKSLYLACLLISLELLGNLLMVWKVKYTEIDWKAYMQEVEGFLNGTWDYTQLKGDTGPLVYPAGFVYIFSGLYYVTSHGTNIRLAQYIFVFLYLITIATVIYIYSKAKTPPYVLLFLSCFAYRVHSIFALRLFNDPVAMQFFYISVIFFMHNKWTVGCVFYSLAVSVKMNIFLSAPGLLLLLIEACGWIGTIKNLTLCALIQFSLGVPFMYENFLGYMICAFNLGRQFIFKWTVNWRFLPTDIFYHRGFHAMLLLLHLLVLAAFALKKWNLKGVLAEATAKPSNRPISSNRVLTLLFESNFIGICFARSLHYQFCVWYYHTLPFLLWSTGLPKIAKILILFVIEVCWNIYPSTTLSSAVLHLCHLLLLVGLWRGSREKSD